VPQTLIRRREAIGLALVAFALVMIAAAANVPVAVLLRKGKQFMPPPSSIVRSKAAHTTWPARTPHDRPWLAPSDWNEARGWGWAYYDVRSAPDRSGSNGFQMTVKLSGWPLPVLEDKQMWWDWSDPTLGRAEPNPAISLRWSGVLLNPLLLGGGAFVLLAGAPAVVVIVRRGLRRRGKRCTECGYPSGVSAVCTECGAPRSP
jgi:hypothetical protein